MSQEPHPLADTRLSRRKMLIGLGMVAASATAYARQPVPNMPKVAKKNFEDMMPDKFGQWTFATTSGVVLPPPDALSDRLYDNLVTRIYTNPEGQPVMFLTAYNNRQDGVLQIHRPEICYPAGGFALSPTRPADIDLASGQSIPANSFLATARDREETVLYFTRLGSAFPQRWVEQRMGVVEANLAGIIPDGLLFRVSTFGGDVERERALLEDFTRQFITASPPRLRKLMLGDRAQTA